MKSLKTLGIAGGFVAAALIGGTLISAASAAPSASNTTPAAGLANGTPDAAKYCATWQQTFATELGVSVVKLVPAAKAATIAAVDAAVKAGDLPSDIGERIKAQVTASNGDGCRLLGGFLHGIAAHGIRADARHDLVGAAATALNMTPADLVKGIRAGDSLKKIAVDQKVSYDTVTKAITDAARADLDALVSAGRLTQARADALLSRLADALKSGNFPRLGGLGLGHMG